MKNKKPANLRHIAYCGLYCPKCYKMKIAAPAKQLLGELLSAQKKGARYLQELPKARPLLKKLTALECKKFCREGGGKSLNCPIRVCCDQHKIIGCWKCRDLDICKKLKPQFFMNSKKLKKLGIKKYIEQYL